MLFQLNVVICGNMRDYIVCYDTVHNDTNVYLTIDTLYEKVEVIDTIADWECYRFFLMKFGGMRIQIQHSFG